MRDLERTTANLSWIAGVAIAAAVAALLAYRSAPLASITEALLAFTAGLMIGRGIGSHIGARQRARALDRD